MRMTATEVECRQAWAAAELALEFRRNRESLAEALAGFLAWFGGAPLTHVLPHVDGPGG
jgi:hypothetical protein